MDFDWIIQELQVQSSVCEMTKDDKKVRDLSKAIAALKKQNGYRLPKMMNFMSIYHPPKYQPSAIPQGTYGINLHNSNRMPPAPIQSTGTGVGSSGSLLAAIANGSHNLATGVNVNTHASIGNIGYRSAGTAGIVPLPTAPCPTSTATIYPSSFYNSNNNPKVGDEIFAGFKDEDGNPRFCIYTWQEDNNPEELLYYAVGWDAYDPIDGTQRWMPCKKHTHEKLLVVCLNECCQQNI